MLGICFGLCGKEFAQKGNMKIHIVRYHNGSDGTGEPKLTEESEATALKESNTNNTRIPEPEKKVEHRFVLMNCDLCQNKFLNEDSLTMHKRTEH